MTSLSDPVFAQAAADPEQEAARGAGTVLTYQQLADATLAYAGMLADIGIEPGDRALFIAPTLPGVRRGLPGINAAGAIIVPVNLPAPLSELWLLHLRRRLQARDRLGASVCRPRARLPRPRASSFWRSPTVRRPTVALPHRGRRPREDEVGWYPPTSGTTGKTGAPNWTIGNLTRRPASRSSSAAPPPTTASPPPFRCSTCSARHRFCWRRSVPVAR